MAGQLLHNLILFGRVLRGLGLEVNPSRVLDVFHALKLIDLGRQPDFYFTLRGLLVHRHEDQSLFDQAFHLFWRVPVDRWEIAQPAAPQSRRRPRVVPPPLSPPPAAPDPAPEGAGGDQPPLVEATLTYSAAEVLRRKDFAELTAEELAAVQAAIARLAWR
ncbi:MAG: hypothetical protein JNK29_06790, partial [Anaerolineales bacterium]|nr:hypothetical protein [Anaerolineales bacterium]